jgi:hypothetical protein
MGYFLRETSEYSHEVLKKSAFENVKETFQRFASFKLW